MELDFSIRHCVEEPCKQPREETSTDEASRSKRSLSPTPSSDAHTLPSTPGDVKRLREEINSAFEEAVCSDDLSVPLSLFGGEIDRPPTPDDVLNLRALIEAEAEDAPLPVPIAMDVSPPPKEDLFKHAGLFREYGGIKGWLEMQRKEKERVSCDEKHDS